MTVSHTIILFDTESDGLLEAATKLHCIVIHDEKSGARTRYNDQPTTAKAGTLEDGLRLLFSADEIVAHNSIRHDVPLIKKLYPWWDYTGVVTDTLVLSQLIWTNLKEADFAFQKGHPKYPSKYIGSHSLGAWGHRLGELKGEYTGGWENWSTDMEDYCDQDVTVLLKLWQKCKEKNYSPVAIKLEHDVAEIIFRQIQHGVLIDYKALTMFIAKLQAQRAELETRLRSAFDPWYVRDGGKDFTPKRDSRNAGYTAGASLCKVKQVVFNPGSRAHIASRLMHIYGWQPVEMNQDGPRVDEDTLSGLDYPPVKDIIEYLTTGKMLGMCAEGKNCWLHYVDKDGYIHGGVTPNGAVTGRSTHSRPNLAQVPAPGKSYGEESRACFVAPAWMVMVGADLSGIELRCMAHFMHRYDGGAYGRAVVEGKQEDGTDVHSLNAKALGFDPQKIYMINGAPKKGRDIAKTFIYAMTYGAGAAKLGSIVGKGPSEGNKLKATFLRNLPALKKLVDAVKCASKRGYLVGLDGRHIHVRSEHSALNSLLQSAGAIIAKRAMVIADKAIRERHLPAQQVLFIHDELQFYCHPINASELGALVVDAFKVSGESFNLNVAISGEYKSGNNWSSTH